MSGDRIDSAITALYRDDWARIVAKLVRLTRDLDAAEDALQEAMTRAISTWPRDGVPANPAGWISTTAQRIAIDSGRRSTALLGKVALLALPEEPDASLHTVDAAFGDDRLRLIFTCCHPILTHEARVALTLHPRAVCAMVGYGVSKSMIGVAQVGSPVPVSVSSNVNV